MQTDYNDVSKRMTQGCKYSTDLWTQTQNAQLVQGYKSLSQATEDEGYCLGWQSGGFMRTPLSAHAPAEFWGDQILPEFCPGMTIEVVTGYLAYHGGSHWIDMIPQNDSQTEGLPICPNGVDTPFVNNIADYPIPCWWKDDNPVSSKGTIILHAPQNVMGDSNSEYYDVATGAPTSPQFSAGAKVVVKYSFELPYGVDYQEGPITFRWMWMCGVNVATAEIQYYGAGELWHNCADAKISSTCGSSPIPTTTQAPNTNTVVTTTNPSEPVDPNEDKDCAECLSLCLAACDAEYWITAPGDLACWDDSYGDRYFVCKCVDGTTPAIDGCNCDAGQCPTGGDTPSPAPTPAPTPATTAQPTPETTTAEPISASWKSRNSYYVTDSTCEAICSINNPVCCSGSDCYSFQLCEANASTAPSLLI
jgi:hypothetical protein